jgi:very-short-patch-repair endonuclease
MDDIAIRLRAGGGVLQRRSHSDVSGSLDRLLRTGLLTALLPGVYCATTDTGDLDVRIRAAALWGGPDAVVTSSCAARLTYWPSCRPEIVTLALPTQSKRSVHGFDLQTRRIPGWLTCRRNGVVATSPALTAVDLAGGAGGGEAIDRLLLSRAATLDDLWEAFRAQPRRRQNKARAALLWDSRAEPWSEAERLQHQLLRTAGISGWRANRWVSCGSAGYTVDVLFRRQRVVLEIDGWDSHGGRPAFEADRRRRNELVLAGYRVLNFTWRQLVDDPTWVLSCIRSALAG